ncbi:hypothetical protein AB0L41_12655 [Amycolatopsis mediterranei]|uniref:hypothetical protein n=1 Tax=Amycolatopsis mediterranei TaxID=33910 RepID=UPI003444A97A
MGRFFEELAKKLAERWLALLALPGALFLVVAVIGGWQGHRAALDGRRLRQGAQDLSATLSRLPAGIQVGLLVGALLGAVGVGLVVQAFAGVTRLVWLGSWPEPLLRWRVQARRRRWLGLVGQRRSVSGEDPDRQDKIDRLAGKANRIALAEPGRPTWMGDRVHAVEKVALARFGLDLTFGWPRLWLVLPDTVRAEITAAEASFAAAVATGTWSLPYLALAIVWWPAAVVGVAFGITGWSRARAAIGDLGALSEAAVDLHGRTLALALGVADQEETGVLTAEQGRKITSIVRKGR